MLLMIEMGVVRHHKFKYDPWNAGVGFEAHG